MKTKRVLAAVLLCLIAALLCACGKAQSGNTETVERIIPQVAI